MNRLTAPLPRLHDTVVTARSRLTSSSLKFFRCRERISGHFLEVAAKLGLGHQLSAFG
jgi:hypothetical protein